MTPSRFLETRSKTWDRLETLTDLASRKGIRYLNVEQLHELTRLYPAIAVDVARARMYNIDTRTQQRINNLAIAAHGLLYRRRKRHSIISSIWKFLSQGYPRLFRSLWPYVTVAIIVFSISTLGAYVGTRLKPSNAYLFVPGELDCKRRSKIAPPGGAKMYHPVSI